MSKEESKKVLKDLGGKIVQELKKGKNPEIVFPLRNLSNIVYDKKTKTLKLGNKTGTRSFFNVAHSKKFLQTVEVASVIKDKLLDSGKHSSLRDVFYMVKKTIPGTKVNLVDDQSESISPDEPILVRINDTLQFVTGEELLAYARKNADKIYDDGDKERYTNLGLKVCAFDSNYMIQELPATLVIKHPSNTVKKFVTASGKSVKVTESHSLFTSRQGFPHSIPAKDLSVGDWVAVPGKIRVQSQEHHLDIVHKLCQNCPNEILAIITLKGDKKVLSQILREVNSTELSIFCKKYYSSEVYTILGNWRRSAIPLLLLKELNLDLKSYYPSLKISCKGAKHSYNPIVSCNKDLALILGLLLSEGSHYLGKRKERIVTLSNKQKDYLTQFQSSFFRSFGDSTAGKINFPRKGIYTLNVGYDLFSYILEYCLEYKTSYAWEKTLPSFLFDSEEKVISTFLKWYRLGDGSITDSSAKLIRFHTTSPHLKNALIFLLLRMGIQSRTYFYQRSMKNEKWHDAYEIRIGDRQAVQKLALITDDFKGKDIQKKTRHSSDKIIGVGTLIKESLDKLKLDEKAYKKFSWYSFSNQKVISKDVVGASVSLLNQFGEVDEKLNQILSYDIAWDKIVRIEDGGIAPFTIDLAVPATQNFIGGNGLILLHNSDKAIEDLEVMTGVSREEMHVNANKNGSVAGKVIIEDRGDTIDWSKLGSGGWSIPSNIEEIKFKKVEAKYILYMEKAAVWERLNEDKYWQKNDAIILASQGQTTRGIRRLLQRLYEEYNLPIYVCCDGDIYGAYIYSVIKYGSIALSHASERLTIPSVRYIGITMDDIEEYDLKGHFIKLDEKDYARIKQVSEYEWFKDNKDWQRQFKLMKEYKAKVEIQSLSSKDISFISEKYLPKKIKNKEFLD